MSIPAVVSAVFGLAPYRDREVLPGGAVRLNSAHSSLYVIPVGQPAKRVIIVDAGMDQKARGLATYLEGLGLGLDAVEAAFITHAHADHVGALHALPDAAVYIGGPDSQVLTGAAPSQGPVPRNIDRLSRKHHARVPGVLPTVVTEGQTLTFGDITIRTVNLSGHTDGSLGYLVRKGKTGQWILFVGDALDFKRDGRVVNAAPPFTADAAQSARSIMRAAKLIGHWGLSISTVVPAHSGNGSFSAMQAFRA